MLVGHQQNRALILGGGGARAAYQVGVLKAIAELLPPEESKPFNIICGTSAGSINAAALASDVGSFRRGVKRLHKVWANFTLSQVFKSDGWSMFKRVLGWGWNHLGLGKWHNGPISLLDNSPLAELLENTIQFERIREALQCGDLHAYSITACSYTNGESTTFFEGDEDISSWKRTHRWGHRVKIDHKHLLASAAIPVVFPAVKIGEQYYGDGSMRQTAPLSPALHLGADKLLIIGLRNEKDLSSPSEANHPPSLGQISGYILDTLFLNGLYSDLERMQRINRTVSSQAEAGNSTLKPIDYLVISPSEDIADVASKHFDRLPKGFRIALWFLGLHRQNSRRFISYLMFVEDFCLELIQMGYDDAMQKKEEIQLFLR